MATLQAAAQDSPHRGNSGYVILTTADVMLALVNADPGRWSEIGERANLSIEGYRVNLGWAIEHPTEAIGLRDSEVDAALPGVRLSVQLAEALEAAERIAARLAGSERPDAASILPGVILSLPEADAGVVLPEGARARLRKAALVELPASPAPVPAAADRSEQLGFNIGTFLGAFVVSLLGGLSLAIALGVALLVRTVAVRTRKRSGGRPLGALAALGLIAAIALVATAATGFDEDRQAVADLRDGKSAIEAGHLVGAMQYLARAGLLENESVSITVLQSCVDWELGYKDYALFEAQIALQLGYGVGEETHYRGRGCFLDALTLRGVDFVKMPAGGWFIYPQPDKDDGEGQRLLRIAQDTETTRFGDHFTALGCLANRYDMRALAAYDFSIGLNSSYRLGEGETPFPAVKRCLRSKSVGDWYVFRTNPEDGTEEFRPVDLLDRIPSPERHDPPDVCWARFPVGGPCGVDE
jgi:hypothetical protein